MLGTHRPNGAGKSTLLSLITADNPQAYANDIYLFDRKRGTGESIWEIKQKIGYLSPNFNSILIRQPLFLRPWPPDYLTPSDCSELTSMQDKMVMEWLQFLDCAEYCKPVAEQSASGLTKANSAWPGMIKTPPLLVLDEPCQGLDGAQTGFTLDIIDQYCARFGASLIFVSHYQEEFPACITKSRLKRGKLLSN